MHPQIPHDFFDAVFGQIAIAAVQLQCLIGNVEAGVGHKTLGHGREPRGSDVFAIECGGGVPQQCARGFKLGRHVGEAKLQRLKLVEAPAESLPVAHIGECFVQSGLRAAE